MLQLAHTCTAEHPASTDICCLTNATQLLSEGTPRQAGCRTAAPQASAAKAHRPALEDGRLADGAGRARPCCRSQGSTHARGSGAGRAACARPRRLPNSSKHTLQVPRPPSSAAPRLPCTPECPQLMRSPLQTLPDTGESPVAACSAADTIPAVAALMPISLSQNCNRSSPQLLTMPRQVLDSIGGKGG